jgi:hypothetical protein
MVEHGHALLSTTIKLARSTRSALAEIPGIRVLSRSDLVGPDLAETRIPSRSSSTWQNGEACHSARRDPGTPSPRFPPVSAGYSER